MMKHCEHSLLKSLVVVNKLSAKNKYFFIKGFLPTCLLRHSLCIRFAYTLLHIYVFQCTLNRTNKSRNPSVDKNNEVKEETVYIAVFLSPPQPQLYWGFFHFSVASFISVLLKCEQRSSCT